MDESVLSELFARLEIAVIQRLSEGIYKPVGCLPDWFSGLFSNIKSEQEDSFLIDETSFLNDFLMIAEEFWNSHNEGQVKSDIWTEVGSSDQQYRLEATAICLGTTNILLIQSLGAEFDEKKSLLQRTRESNLAQEYLKKEIQDAQTLIYSIAYEMGESLAGINNFLSLLDFNKLTLKERRFFEISRRQTQNLKRLIEELTTTVSQEKK